MVAEVFAGISAFKSMLDIAKSIKDMNDIATRQGAVIELREQILSAQAAQAQLVETVGELKKRVAELEAWDVDKQRYELKSVAPGSFAYALKKEAQGSKPAHQICAACYGRNKKFILQIMPTSAASLHLRIPMKYQCPECKSEIVAEG